MSPSKPRRKLVWWVRWLHTYVSLAGFGALIFFSLTGITLNHAEWFEGVESTTERAGTAPTHLLAETAGPAAGIALMGWLRNTEHLNGHPGEPLTDEFEMSISFEGAGYIADVVIDRESGEYSVLETRRGLVAVMNDLHKGRHTSFAWDLLIDVSALILTLSGATGIWLLWFLKKIRLQGLLWAVGGTAILFFAYFAWQ